MAGLLQSLFYLSLMYQLVVGVEYCDQIEDEAIYCLFGEEGWEDCKYTPDSLYLIRNESKKCPAGTRCACFYDEFCNKPKEQLCIPRPVIPSWPVTFALKYNEVLLQEAVWYDEENILTINNGIIMHDGKQQKTFYKKNNTSVLIVTKRNSFVKYSWTSDESCTKSDVPVLNPYMPNIHAYLLRSTTKAGLKELRTYYWKDGRNSWAFNFYQRWYDMVYNPTEDTMLPMKFKETMYGHDLANYNNKFDTTYKPFRPSFKMIKDVFTIPKQCEKN